jgi:hypothetical protein
MPATGVQIYPFVFEGDKRWTKQLDFQPLRPTVAMYDSGIGVERREPAGKTRAERGVSGH